MSVAISISEIKAMQKVKKEEIQKLLKEHCEAAGTVTKIEFIGYDVMAYESNDYINYPTWFVWEGKDKYSIAGEVKENKLTEVWYQTV